MAHPTFKDLTVTSPDPTVYIVSMHKAPENRVNVEFAQTIISALQYIDTAIGPNKPAAVIIKGSDAKFWCTALNLNESERKPFANADGFYPLLTTLLDYPFPTIALLTGHIFGGACPFSLSCDYRIINSKPGFYSMPPVNLGLHFDRIGALPRLKLHPQIARKMLLEAHKWVGKEALADGVVDEIAEPEVMEQVAVERVKEHANRATMGVYSLLRNELWGKKAAEKFKQISYVRGRPTVLPAKAKI